MPSLCHLLAMQQQPLLGNKVICASELIPSSGELYLVVPAVMRFPVNSLWYSVYGQAKKKKMLEASLSGLKWLPGCSILKLQLHSIFFFHLLLY